MIPDSIIVAACTIPESLNSKKTARGIVEKRVDPETVIIKVGQDKIEAKVPEGKLQAGDAVILKVRKDYVLLEKVQIQSEQSSRQPDTFSSEKPLYSSKQISSVLNTAIDQLKAEPNNHHLPQRIISVINAMKSGISDNQREALRKAVTAAADPGNSPAEIQSRRQELINLLESIEKEIVKSPPVKGSEKLIILEIPDRNIPEGLYKFSGKEDLQAFLQRKGIQIPDPGNTHNGSAESRKDLYLRTFPSDSGTTAILLDKMGSVGELESWTRGFSSSAMQSIPVRVFEQILSSVGKIDLSALNQIDAILQSAQYTLPQSRAGSEAAQAASVAQWLQTALENSSILTEITMRPPVSASTVAIQLEEINRSLSDDSIHHLTTPEQIAVTDKILESRDNRADFLTKLMQKIGYNFENKIAASENVKIGDKPDLKSSLLSFINSIKESTPVKSSPQVDEVKETLEKIESLRKSIEARIQAPEMETPEVQTEKNANIVAKAVSLAHWIHTTPQSTQATTSFKGKSGRDNNFASTLSFLLKEISTSIDKKVLPEFTDPVLAEKAADSVDTKSKTDFFAKLLRMFAIDAERGNGESNPAQKSVFHDLSKTILSLFGAETGTDSLESNFTQKSNDKTFVESSRFIPEQGDPEKISPEKKIPPEDIKELLTKVESLRRSIEAQQQVIKTGNSEAQVAAKAQVIARAVSIANWFNSSEDGISAALNAILKEISSPESKLLSSITNPQYVKDAAESPDVKSRADLWAKLPFTSGVTENRTDTTSALTQKHSPSDLVNTIISFLTAGEKIKPPDDISDFAADKAYSSTPSQNRPEQVKAENVLPSGKNNLSPEEIREFQARIESLKKTIEAHSGAANIGSDEEKWKERTLIVEKTISLARWLNSSSETDQTEVVKAERPNTVSAINALLKEIITAIDKKSLPEFTTPAFVRNAVESVESTGRNGLLEQILRISGTDTVQGGTHSKSVFRQAFIELTSSIASFLIEKNSSSSEATQEISSRDTGGKPLTYTSFVKTEHVNAEKAIPPQGNRIPPEDTNELLEIIDSLRKSLQARLQLSGAEFTDNQAVSKGKIEEKAAALVKWFSSGAEVSQSGREITSENEKNASILNSLLKAIHTALDKRSLPEFSNPECVKSTAESPDVKSRIDFLAKLLEKSGIRPDYQEISRDIPEKTAPVVTQMGNHSPEQTAAAGTGSQFRTENIEELKVQLESLKKELMSQLQKVEAETGRKQIEEGLVNLAKALSEIPDRLEKLISEKLISSERSDISDSISRSLIKEFLSDKAVTDAFLLKFHSIPIPDDSTLLEKIKVLTEMIADPSAGKGEQLIQTLKEFISGKLPAHLSLLSGLLNGIASASPEKEQSGSQLFSFIRNETAEIIKNIIPETFDWFSEKLTETKLPATVNQGTAQKSDAPQVLKPEYLPSLPALRTNLVNTATEILNTLQSFEKALNTQLSSLIPAVKESAGQAESMPLPVLSGNRQPEAAKQMINLPEVIGMRVTRALREIRELAGRIIPESKTEEEGLTNAASGRDGVKTRQSVRETVSESITRREFLNRTEQVISKAVSDLKDTLARVNTGSHDSLSGGTGHTRLQGHTVQTSVILEKAVEEVIRHLRDLQDSIKDNSSSHISKQADRNESTRAYEPGSSERLSEKSIQHETDVFTGKAQIRQSVESLLNRLESLQLLARQTPTPSGDQQIVALPMKIGGEWTEVNIRFIKKKEGRDKKSKQNHFSVYLNVSPSQLGAISVKLEYELKKSMCLDIEFEKRESRSWFSRNSESLRKALSKLDLPQVQMIIHQVRTKEQKREQKREQYKETDGAIDLKI